jgi:Arc-like DNA binding domain
MESETPPPRRGRGRPSKGSEAKRASFNTRIREALKQRLEAAAFEAGRSLSEEIEFRLEQSFVMESTVADLKRRLEQSEDLNLRCNVLDSQVEEIRIRIERIEKARKDESNTTNTISKE